MARADEEKTDYELHEALVDAIRRGDVTVDVDYPRINRGNVPGFRTTDFIVPPLAIIVISLIPVAWELLRARSQARRESVPTPGD